MRGLIRKRADRSSICNVPVCAIVIAVILHSVAAGRADESQPANQTLLNTAANTIDELSQSPFARQATVEIAEAKRLLEKGILLKRAGHTEKASLYARQLALQLKLVNAVMATAKAQRDAMAAESALKTLKRDIAALKDRHAQIRDELTSTHPNDTAEATSQGASR